MKSDALTLGGFAGKFFALAQARIYQAYDRCHAIAMTKCTSNFLFALAQLVFDLKSQNGIVK